MPIIRDESVRAERAGTLPGKGTYVVAGTSLDEEISPGRIAYGRLLFYAPREGAPRWRCCVTWLIEVGPIVAGPGFLPRVITTGTPDGARAARERVLDDLARHFYQWVSRAWKLRDHPMGWDAGLLYARRIFRCDGWAVDGDGAVHRDRVPWTDFKAYRTLYRLEGGATLLDAYLAYCRWIAEKRGQTRTRLREALIGSGRKLRCAAWDAARETL
jgi:hypothetical protein